MNITIVGGGTAGWLTAFLLAKRQSFHKITVIESSSIPIVGVGEGVTGKLTDLFNDPILELDEFEFLQQTWALPKYGILFKGWSKDVKKQFYSPIEGSITEDLEIDTFLYNAVYNNKDTSLCSVSGHYFNQNLIPWFEKDNNIYWIGGKAYHIDAYKVGEFFKQKCLDLGVTHLDNKIQEVIVQNGIVTSLQLESGSFVEADFYFDCSGFHRVLFSKLDVQWIDKSKSLPVDRGFIFKPDEYNDTKKSYTTATAKKNGWIFEIPTRYKIGRGYIYSSDFSTEDKIVEELENIYGSISKVQLIKFKSGRFNKAWSGNCVSLGLASGFLEPLQATSLHITLCEIETFIKKYLMNTISETLNQTYVDLFNDYYVQLTDDMLDFVQVTYLGGRDDTEFWNYMNNDSYKSNNLKNILELAKTRLIRASDFKVYHGYAGQALWNYTLAGLGYFNKPTIEKVFAHAKIDLQQVNVDWEIFNTQMQPSLENMLTVEELNDLLIRGEKYKLTKIF